MSVDVSYYSFSPSRADKKWKEEGDEKISELNRIYTRVELDWEESRLVQEKAYEVIKERYEKLETSVRKRYVGTTLDYEWDSLGEVEEFLTDEEKNEIESLLKEKSDYEKQLAAPMLDAKKKATPPATVSYEEIVGELQIMDLEFGGVDNGCYPNIIFYENAWLEQYCLDACVEVFSLATEDGVPTKSGWLRLFSELEPTRLEQLETMLINSAELGQSEARESIVSYLKEIRPVVLDLKETGDAVFYRQWGGADGDPVSAEKLLQDRAKQLRERYRKDLPTITEE